MSDEATKLCFIDTNVWFYSFVEQDDPVKSHKARELIRAAKPAVSTQVINEICANAYWDSLIVASALSAGCGMLYSEDMSHGLLVNRRLKILNPFAP